MTSLIERNSSLALHSSSGLLSTSPVLSTSTLHVISTLHLTSTLHSTRTLNSTLGLPTRIASSGLNVSMCYPHGDDYSTACSCRSLFNERATTFTTIQAGALTETGQYAYAGYYSTRPTTLHFTNTYQTVIMTDTGYIPPLDCCADRCQIDADEVRILYWPVDANGTNGKMSNVSMTAAPAPSGVVVGGMTL